MARIKLLLTFFVITLAGLSAVQAVNSREFGPYIGGGLSKTFATVTQPGVNASVNGSGENFEFGFDLPVSETFGFTAAIELGQKELRNTAQSVTYLDDTKISTRALRGSLFYKSAYLGGSYQTAGADLVAISTASGSSSAHVDLTGSSFFVGYAITYKNLLRANVEGESTNFTSPGFNYTDYTVGLKLNLLIAGFFDR
jgi:hypothetical protein